MYTLMCSNNISLQNIINTEDEDVTANNPALDWVSRVLPEEQQQIQGPRPCHNYFGGGLLSNNAETAESTLHAVQIRPTLPSTR